MKNQLLFAAVCACCALASSQCTWKWAPRGTVRRDILSAQAQNPAAYPHAVEELTAIDVNGVQEWLLIRGYDRRNPVLLSVNGGPGFPNMWNIGTAALLLEHHFTVVYWEQRGTMKSWNRKLTCADMTLGKMADDAIAVSEYLVRRFDQNRIYLRGESFGTITALRAAARRPDLYRAYIAIAQIAEYHENEVLSTAFVDSCARAAGDKKALRMLNRLDTTEIPKEARQRRKLKALVGQYGGWFYDTDVRKRGSALASLRRLLATPEYTLGEVRQVLGHDLFSVECLLAETKTVNLFREVQAVSVPVFFMSGRHDKMVPAALTRRYFEALRAPAGKSFIWFEKSAHNPMVEEPYRYYEEMLRIREAIGG